MTRFEQAKKLAQEHAAEYEAAQESTNLRLRRGHLHAAIHTPEGHIEMDDSNAEPELWYWAVFVGGFAGLVWLFAMGY